MGRISTTALRLDLLTAMQIACLVCGLLLTGVADARGQTSEPSLEGKRVRVSSTLLSDGPIRGYVAIHGPDTLVIQRDPGGTFDRLPIHSITRLELSTGRRSQWARGMGLGFAGGAAFGGIFWALSAGTGTGEIDLPTSHAAGLGALFFGAGGALVGALVGSGIDTDEWAVAPLDGLSLSVGPTRRAPIAFGVSLRTSW